MISTLLPPFLSRKAVSAQSVAILGQRQNAYTVLLNAYLQEVLGPRVSGSVLNVGAGVASTQYNQGAMFAASEYHTLESEESGVACTYICSATDMRPIPADRYDWIVSTYVFEHIDDPFAAAREQLRVCKPGGYIYAAVPFAQVMHPHATFGDFWRFTPQGVARMFQGASVVEIEVWGENPTRPNGYSVLLQKDGGAATQPPKAYWIEFDNEQPFELLTPGAATHLQWAVYELKIEPVGLATQLNNARDQYALQANLVVDNATVCKRFKDDYARRLGTLEAIGARSRFTPYEP